MMNPDEEDIIRALKNVNSKRSVKEDEKFLKGLQDRTLGHLKKNFSAKQYREEYAEDELIRKEKYEELRCEVPALSRSTFLMVFSPDGSKVASTHGNHNIYVTDIRSGKNIRTLVGHPRTPWCIAFHPTSNQIVASGCLGGQVRIWDLSGGSEVWTAGNQSVIASIAFHPNDRVLVIATFNEIYFWDWSKPEPFVQCATSNPKEKVRFVAFDKLGHKLITGIANSPQTRWERVRAPVPVPRQVERSASPYRRRITPRLVNLQPPEDPTSTEITERDTPTQSSIPERERRITRCYRNLLYEYEQLVQRYLQLYRPPTMIDRGTDPMEPNALSTTSGTQTAGPSTSTSSPTDQPSTSSSNTTSPPNSNRFSVPLMTPSRMLAVIKKPNMFIKGTQTAESRKHKSSDKPMESSQEKRIKTNTNTDNSNSQPSTSSTSVEATPGTSRGNVELNRLLDGAGRTNDVNKSTSSSQTETTTYNTTTVQEPTTSSDVAQNSQSNLPGTTLSLSATQERSINDYVLSHIRQTAEEEVRTRILPIIRSVPAPDRPELIRLFENNREHVRMRFRQLYPILLRKHSRRPVIDTTSDSSSSEDDAVIRFMPPSTDEPMVPAPASNLRTFTPQTTSSTNTGTVSRPPTDSNTVRNFNTELEQLVTSLLTEIERNDSLRTNTPNTSGELGPEEAERARRILRQATAAHCTLLRRAVQLSPAVSTSGSSSIQTTVSVTTNVTTTSETQQPSSSNVVISNTTTTNSQVYHFNSCSDYWRFLTTPSSSTANASSSNIPSTSGASTTTTFSNRRPRFSLNRRVSAFRPLRFRLPIPDEVLNRKRTNLPPNLSPTRDLSSDETVNYSERADSEGEPRTESRDSSQPLASDIPFDAPLGNISHENIGIGNMYSNILQDLEDSLVPVRLMQGPDCSSILNRFSERLQIFINQSDVILRNINTADAAPSTPRSTEPSVTYNDGNFYLRDQRNDPVPPPSDSPESPRNPLFNPIAGDHTYPRNASSPGYNDNLSPIMNSAHFTISMIQQNARHLLNRVQNIERIDRAMLEVSQLQLIRQLIVELVRHMQSITENNTRSNSGTGGSANASTSEPSNRQTTSGNSNRITGLASVRQMMAGTRISDNAPPERPPLPTNLQETLPPLPLPTTTTTSTATAPPIITINQAQSVPTTASNHSASGGSSSGTSSSGLVGRTRCSGRKTYPPSRLFRLQRQCRRTCVVHFFPRRYMGRPDRSSRQAGLGRSVNRPSSQDLSNPLRSQPLSSYSLISSSTLSLMTRRLEYLLTDQMRMFTDGAEATTSHQPRSSPTTDLGEHIIVLRLHGCILRMNRVLNNSVTSHALRNFRSDSAAVTHDGVSRYSARHTLSLIIDGMSRDMEEMNSSNLSLNSRLQIHGLLAMSLLLSELLLLQIVDSIPASTARDVDPDSDFLTQMCGRVLRSNATGLSRSITRRLRIMRIAMHHVHNILIGTYNSRRNSLMPNRVDTDHRELFGSINRCLGAINSRRHNSQGAGSEATAGPSTSSSEAPSQQASSGTGQESNVREYFSTLCELIARYSDNSHNINFSLGNNNNNTDSPESPHPQEPMIRPAATSLNPEEEEPPVVARPGSPHILVESDNDDDDDDDTEFSAATSSSSRGTTLYRTSNVNLVGNQSQENLRMFRPWNVPSVQVNDVPVSEPSNLINQRYLSQRNRFAERVSELRSNHPLGLFRPRFLHPLYASVNPFDAELDDPQREQIYDSDMVTTVTPNHRIQAWDISTCNVPVINNPTRNLVVGECKIHNDASVDISRDGTILVTLLPSGGYLNVTNRLGIYSLRWESLGQCLYITNLDQNAVSVSLSPLSRHLVVGLASRRVSIVPSDRWTMAKVFKIEQKDVPGDRLPVLRELEQNRDGRATNYKSVNCIRWLPTSGQGLIYATNTGQLVILT